MAIRLATNVYNTLKERFDIDLCLINKTQCN